MVERLETPLKKPRFASFLLLFLDRLKAGSLLGTGSDEGRQPSVRSRWATVSLSALTGVMSSQGNPGNDGPPGRDGQPGHKVSMPPHCSGTSKGTAVHARLTLSFMFAFHRGSVVTLVTQVLLGLPVLLVLKAPWVPPGSTETVVSL